MNGSLGLQSTVARTHYTPLGDSIRAVGGRIRNRQKIYEYQAAQRAKRVEEFKREWDHLPFAFALFGAGIACLLFAVFVATGPAFSASNLAALVGVLCLAIAGIGLTSIGSHLIEKIHKQADAICWQEDDVDINDLQTKGVPDEFVAVAWQVHVRHPSARFSIQSFEGDPFIDVRLRKEKYCFGNWNTPGFEE